MRGLTDAEVMALVRRVIDPAILGESVHTALRKCDAVTDMKVYRAIQDMPDDQWHAAMEWVVSALIYYVEQELKERNDAH